LQSPLLDKSHKKLILFMLTHARRNGTNLSGAVGPPLYGAVRSNKTEPWPRRVGVVRLIVVPVQRLGDLGG
jgi:hypothetical protein